jgi:hypothetical protein
LTDYFSKGKIDFFKNNTLRNGWGLMRGNKLFLSKAKVLLFILFLSSFFIGQIAYAEGDGTGGGKSEALMLNSSSINDGATGVSLKPEIKLTFSKNIVNMTVYENNMKCFSLQTANGTSIPIDVILADDQIEFEKRNDAIITPKANLAQGTTYSVVISPSLMSKSGVTTGKVIKITFTTGGVQSVPTPNVPVKETPKSESAAPKVETTTKTEPVSPKDTATTKNTTNTTSTVDEKPASDQTTTDSQTDTTDEYVVTDINSQKSTPYEAAKPTANSKTAKSQASNSSSIIYGIVISLIVIVAAIIIYYFMRKKRAK